MTAPAKKRDTASKYDMPKVKKQREKQRYQLRHNLQTGYHGVRMAEATNFSTVFGFNSSTHALSILFGTPLRFILFPFAALAGLSITVLEWLQFHIRIEELKDNRLKGHKNASPKQFWKSIDWYEKEEISLSFIEKFWGTLNNLGTTGAVLTGIIGYIIGASVGAGISLTFTFFLSVSTLMCAGMGIYLSVRAMQTHEELQATGLSDTKRADLQNRLNGYIFGAKVNFAFMGIVALLTTGVIVSMVMGILLPGAIIGIVGCALAVGANVYFLNKHLNKNKDMKRLIQKEDDGNRKDHHHGNKRKASNTNNRVNVALEENDNGGNVPLDDVRERAEASSTKPAPVFTIGSDSASDEESKQSKQERGAGSKLTLSGSSSTLHNRKNPSNPNASRIHGSAAGTELKPGEKKLPGSYDALYPRDNNKLGKS